jgi:beta-lactamase regulating signal transducer with metallopeptidase domain
MPDLPSFLGEVALRSSFVLAVAFALLMMLKRASASERHLVILFGLLIVAFVPVGLLVSPKFSWTIPLPWQAEAGATTQKMTAYFLEENPNSPLSNSPSIVAIKPAALKILTLSNGLAALILGGMLVQVVVLGRAAWSWQKIRRQAVPARLPGDMLERVRGFAGARNVPPIFSSDQIAVPLLAGWLRPAILLPAEAPHWRSDRLAMVLYHEIAHFRRGDAILLPLICALRVLYWWHPLVWLGLGRLRRERENACDDLVLNQDFRATDYADLIVATARQARALRWQNGALAMASPSHLGERIRAILNPALNRRPASRATLFTGLILAVALGWFFVAAQVQAQDQPAASDSTAAPDVSKPQINLEFKLISIDEKTYLEKQQEIDAAVAKADLPSLIDKMIKMPGVNFLSTPSVTTQEGLRATVDVLRPMSYPTRFDKDKDGKIILSDFRTRNLGVSIEAVPTLQADHQSVSLNLTCEVTSFGGWLDIPSGGRRPLFSARRISSENVIHEHGFAVWVGETTGTDLPVDYEKSPSNYAYPPRRLILFISARPVPAAIKAPASASNPPSKVSGPKPAVTITARIVEVDEKSYQSQAQAMDEAVRNGDILYFTGLGDQVRETDICLLVGQPGWYSEGEVKTYVDSASRENQDGKLVTVLHTKQVFMGLNGDITWSKSGAAINSAWSVSVPLGLDPLPLGPDIPPGDVPSPSLVPRMHVTSFTDQDWDWAKPPGKMHAFWVGDSYGWVKIFEHRHMHGGTLDDMIKSESPSRLAVFMTAQLAKK